MINFIIDKFNILINFFPKKQRIVDSINNINIIIYIFLIFNLYCTKSTYNK